MFTAHFKWDLQNEAAGDVWSYNIWTSQGWYQYSEYLDRSDLTDVKVRWNAENIEYVSNFAPHTEKLSVKYKNKQTEFVTFTIRKKKKWT